MKKNSFYIFSVISIITIFLVIVSINRTYQLFEENSEQFIVLSDYTLNGEKDDFHIRYLTKDILDVYSFKTTVSREEFNRLQSDYYKIILYQICGSSYEVLFNGQLIGSVGDSDRMRSYVWNSLHTFTISKDLLRDANVLEFKIYPSYKIGKSRFPILIASPSAGYKIFDWMNLAFISSFSLVLNMFIFSSLSFLILLFISRRFNQDSVYYLLATFLVIIYMLNYTTIYNLPFSIAVFKKLQYVSLFSAILVTSTALYNKYHLKINLYAGLLLLPVIAITLLAKDTHNVTNKVNIIALLNLLGWLYTSLVNVRKNYEAKTFLVASTLLFLGICYDLMTLITARLDIVRLSNYGIFDFCLGFILIAFDNYVEFQNSFLRRTVEAEKEKEMLHKLAYVDGLTSLYNHRYFYEYFNRQSDHVKTFTVLFCDIDKFKSINDTYGHITGDIILKEIGQIIKRQAPDNNMVFRYGGEEFVVLLENYSPQDCYQIAENIRLAVETSSELYKNTNQIPVTITIGLATYPTDAADVRNLIDKADKAMYYGKKHGRNQCNVFSSDMDFGF